MHIIAQPSGHIKHRRTRARQARCAGRRQLHPDRSAAAAIRPARPLPGRSRVAQATAPVAASDGRRDARRIARLAGLPTGPAGPNRNLTYPPATAQPPTGPQARPR